MKVLKKPLFDNSLPFFLKFETSCYFLQVNKETFNPNTSSMEEHFTT
jgi:hypothetical protein